MTTTGLTSVTTGREGGQAEKSSSSPRGVIDLGVSRVRTLLCRLGHPERRYSVVHVAGTNGKGSTCSFLAAGLRTVHSIVGLYTSPHLVQPRDSWNVNGNLPSIDEYEQYRRRAYDAAAAVASSPPPHSSSSKNEERRPSFSEKKAPAFPSSTPPSALHPTQFEVDVAGCLLWFADQGVQVAVVEVGVGGRADATNVFVVAGQETCDCPMASPLDGSFHDPSATKGGSGGGGGGGGGPLQCTVVTRIGLDHIPLLGTTLSDIAHHKAGILQRGIPCCIGVGQPVQVLRVLLDEAAAVGCLDQTWVLTDARSVDDGGLEDGSGSSSSSGGGGGGAPEASQRSLVELPAQASNTPTSKATSSCLTVHYTTGKLALAALEQQQPLKSTYQFQVRRRPPPRRSNGREDQASSLVGYQFQNAGLALLALLKARLVPLQETVLETMAHAFETTRWAGRLDTSLSLPFKQHETGVGLSLEQKNVQPSSLKRLPVLVDGAHNPDGADQLRLYLDALPLPSRATPKDGLSAETKPHGCGSLTWILGMAQGKDVAGVVTRLLRPGDAYVTVGFTPPEHMPWVNCMDPAQLAEHIQRSVPGARSLGAFPLIWDVPSEVLTSPKGAHVENETREGQPPPPPIIIAGSLYLAADVYRWTRNVEGGGGKK